MRFKEIQKKGADEKRDEEEKSEEAAEGSQVREGGLGWWIGDKRNETGNIRYLVRPVWKKNSAVVDERRAVGVARATPPTEHSAQSWRGERERERSGQLKSH